MLTFFHIASEEQMGGKINEIQPIIVLDNSYLEIIGLVLPLFTGLFMALYVIGSRKGPSRSLPLKWLVPAFLFISVIAIVPLPEIDEDLLIIEDVNTTITTISPNPTLTTSPDNDPLQTRERRTHMPEPFFVEFLTSFASEFRSVLLLVIFFLTIAFLIILRRQSKLSEIKAKAKENELSRLVVPEKSQKNITILECYYQASTSLEERGADDSISFSPSEFTEDVRKKDLCTDSSIMDLTDLFEEAKFSDHFISKEKVKNAKEFAQDIVFSSESIPKEKELEKLESEDE